MNSPDADLIDALKKAFGYKTDVEVAGFLNVDKQSIYLARHGKGSLGITQRFKIIDRILFQKTENLAIRCLPENLVLKIQEIRQLQHQQSALKETENGYPSDADSKLLDLYKDFRRFKTDSEMADAIGIKRQSISMVRTGKNKLGSLPRLRIFRDVWNEDITDLETALESSDSLLKMVQNYIDTK